MAFVGEKAVEGVDVIAEAVMGPEAKEETRFTNILTAKCTEGFLTIKTFQIDAVIGLSNLGFILFGKIISSNTQDIDIKL